MIGGDFVSTLRKKHLSLSKSLGASASDFGHNAFSSKNAHFAYSFLGIPKGRAVFPWLYTPPSTPNSQELAYAPARSTRKETRRQAQREREIIVTATKFRGDKQGDKKETRQETSRERRREQQGASCGGTSKLAADSGAKAQRRSAVGAKKFKGMWFVRGLCKTPEENMFNSWNCSPVCRCMNSWKVFWRFGGNTE